MKKRRKLTMAALIMVCVMSFSTVCLASSKSSSDIGTVTSIKAYITADFFLSKCSGWASTSIISGEPVVPVQVYVFTYKSGTAQYSASAKSNTAGTITKSFTKVTGTSAKSRHYAFRNTSTTTACNSVTLSVQ